MHIYLLKVRYTISYMETAEYLADMPFVLFFGVGVDEDVIQVY